MPKADIHYLYNQKVTNKKFIIAFYNWFRRVFHILKSLHYNFIINTARNVFPYVYNQVVIHPLITYSTSNRLFTIFIAENDLSIVIVATNKFDSKLYIYIPRKKKLTKKLGQFCNTHSFCEFSTHLIVIIKYDVVAIICDGSAIQCDVGTLQFYIY